MKKSFLKIVSLCLTLCMLFSIMIPMNVVSADTAAGTNLIAGTVPFDAYISKADTMGGISYSRFDIRDPHNGLAQTLCHPYMGSINAMLHVKDALVPFLATMTDTDVTDGYVYSLTNSKLTFVYDLGSSYAVDGVSIDFTTETGGYADVKATVYASEDMASLFTAAANEQSAVSSVDIDLEIGKAARYVAVIFEKNSDWCSFIKINNLAFTGKKIENVLKGRLPIVLHTVKNGTFDNAWSQITVGDYMTHGYNESWCFDHFYSFAPYTALLTDDDTTTQANLKPESLYSGKADMIMVYELESATDVYSIEVIKGGWHGVADVYASSNRNDIFSGTPLGTVQWENNTAGAYTSGPVIEANQKNVRYVGLYFNGNSTYNDAMAVTEIRVWGATAENRNNLIVGKKPVSMFEAKENTTDTAWNSNVFLDDTQYSWFGTNKPEEGHEPLAKMTDGYMVTSTAIRNQWNDANDMAVVYQLDSLSSVEAVDLQSSIALRDASVYVGKGYASLFSEENKVADFVANGTETAHTIELATATEGLYVGIILDTAFDSANCSLAEIKVYGNTKESKVNDADVLGGAVSPVNANANETVKSFYQYLKNVGEDDNILIGAHIAKEESVFALNESNNYYNFIERNYGVAPAVVSLTDEFDAGVYVQYYKQGAIPLIGILGDLSSISTFEGIESKVTFIKYFDKTYDPVDDAEAELVTAVLDEYQDLLYAAADKFAEMEANGVKAYMVRPFNEMNVSGFYGDAYNDVSQHFKNVWQQMVEFFVDECGLEGILFVYSPANISDERCQTIMSLYPGNDYVDIIAPTVYSSDNSGSLTAISEYEDILATGKPFGMSEIGILNSYNDYDTVNDCMDMLNSFKTTYKEAAFASLWFGAYGINRHENAENFINNEYLIKVNNMVNWQYENVQPVARVTVSDISGNTAKLAYGKYLNADIADLSIDAFDINSSVKVTVYDGDDCTGNKWVFGRDVAALTDLDITVASIKIEKTADFTIADINSSGSVDIRDLVAIKKDCANTNYRNELASDIDNSGRVDSLDISSLRKIILGVSE